MRYLFGVVVGIVIGTTGTTWIHQKLFAYYIPRRGTFYLSAFNNADRIEIAAKNGIFYKPKNGEFYDRQKVSWSLKGEDLIKKD